MSKKVYGSINVKVQLRMPDESDAHAFAGRLVDKAVEPIDQVFIDPLGDGDLLDRLYAEIKKTVAKPKG